MLQETTTSAAKSLTVLIKDYAINNQVANKRIVSWLRTKPLDVLALQYSSGFESLKQVLIHIWQVEKSWYACLQSPSVAIPYGETFTGTIEEVFEGMLEQSKKFADYTLSVSEEELQATTHVFIPYMLDCNIPRFELIKHCFDHSKQHREELTTIARTIGISGPPLANYRYYLSQGKIYI